MNIKFISLIYLFLSIACVSKTKTVVSDNSKMDTVTDAQKVVAEDNEDTLLLDTIKYDQILLNSLPLQIDTLTAIKTFGVPSSRDVYAFGTCYRFGDAKLWDFKGVRYYIYKDSLYFHELYFDATYKNQNYSLQLPKLKVSDETKLTEFYDRYKTSFTNSKQRLSNSVIFRTGEPLNCQLRFEYKNDRLWRVAVGM